MRLHRVHLVQRGLVGLVETHGGVGQRLAALGMTIDERTPHELDAFIRSEIAKWGKVIRAANIKAEG